MGYTKLHCRQAAAASFTRTIISQQRLFCMAWKSCGMLINIAAFLKFSIDPLLQVTKSIFDGWDRFIWLPVFNLQRRGLKKLCAAFQETSITSVLCKHNKKEL